MNSTTSTPHFAPVDQPASVHQIAARLFSAYTVDDGTLHLAGCSLDDRLFVRLDFSRGDFQAAIHVDNDGNEAGARLVDTLGMTETAKTSIPPDFVPDSVDRLVQRGIQIAQRRWADLGAGDLVSTTLLWCKRVEGKLRFTFGEHWVDLPFSGWTRTLESPPFVCPHSGRETFHLAITDDSRVAAAESIEPCSQTGQRVLDDDLVTCSVTGRRMLPEFAVTCPVTGLPVFGPEMITCDTCHENVSPTAVEGGECSACRDLQPVKRIDPRIAQVLQRHSSLARWGKWRISETATVYILVGSSWVKQFLTVIDKNSLELKLTATAGRWSRRWVRNRE